MTIADIKAYCNDPKNRSTVNVGLFIILIISFISINITLFNVYYFKSIITIISTK